MAAPRTAAGMANLGNTCYFNATLQMLAHSRHVLERLVLDAGTDPALAPSPAAPLWRAVRDLLVSMWLSGGDGVGAAPVVVPADALKAVARRGLLPHGVHDQNDAHELVVGLIDRTSADMVAAVRSARSSSPGPPTPPLRTARRRSAALEDRWRRLTAAEDPRVVALFHGQAACATTCRSCGHCEASDDAFTSLAVALPAQAAEGKLDVQACVDAHFAPEDVGGWRCSVCGETGVAAVRRSSMWRAPLVLLVCLKRFRGLDAVSRTRVEATERLDAAHLAAPGSPAAALLGASHEYRLASVVCHTGSQSGGHYFSCARLPGTDSWHVYNDTRVSELPGGAGQVPADAAYVYAYELVPRERRRR